MHWNSQRHTASTSLYLCLHFLPFFTHIGLCVLEFLDTLRPCSDRLLPCSFLFFRTPLTSQESERKRRMKQSQERTDGFIDVRLGLRLMHQSLDHGGCQGQLHTGRRPHIYLCSSLFRWELYLIALSNPKILFWILLSFLFCVVFIAMLTSIPGDQLSNQAKCDIFFLNSLSVKFEFLWSLF